jgi:hypothetical protein
LLHQGDAIASVDTRVIDPVDELPDHMNADTAGSRLAAGRWRRRWRLKARIEWLSVIGDHGCYLAILRADADLQLVRSALGPSIFDDIAEHLVKRDLKLYQYLAGNCDLLSKAVDRARYDRELGKIIANRKVDIWHPGLGHRQNLTQPSPSAGDE